jgi:hypothetical protein
MSGVAARKELFSGEVLKRRAQPVKGSDLRGELKIYFGMLRLHPLALDLTFTLADAGLISDLLPDGGLIMSLIKTGLESAGTMLANIEHAPISLDALYATHVFETSAMLTHRLITHYVESIIFEVYKIIGSAAFLGNPVGLLSGMVSKLLSLSATNFDSLTPLLQGRDVVNLFYEPGAGLLESPMQAGMMLAASATTLVQNTTVGVLDSAGQILGSAAKGIKAIHVIGGKPPRVGETHQAPSDALSGFVGGWRTFGEGLLTGVTGVVMDPVRGAQRGGVVGALKGLGSGVVGVFTKPVAGALEGMVSLLNGLSASANPANAVAARARLPRFLDSSGRVTQFSAREAEGAARLWLLQAVDPAAQGQHYVFHTFVHAIAKLPGDRVLPPELVSASAHRGNVVDPTTYKPEKDGDEPMQMLPIPMTEDHNAAISQLTEMFVAKWPHADVEPTLYDTATADDEVAPVQEEEHHNGNGPSSSTGGEGGGGGTATTAQQTATLGRRRSASTSAPARRVRVRTGKHKALGVTMTFPLASRQPDLIRAADQARQSSSAGAGAGQSGAAGATSNQTRDNGVEVSRGSDARSGKQTTESKLLDEAPYVLLVTDRMAWLLYARNNAKVWSTHLTCAGLLEKSDSAKAAAIQAVLASAGREGRSAAAQEAYLGRKPLVSVSADGPTLSLVSHRVKKVSY